jgi:hypothetical protein
VVEAKVYTSRLAANRRKGQLAELYPSASWEVLKMENGFAIQATTSRTGAKELADEPVLVFVPTPEEKKAARVAAKEAAKAAKTKSNGHSAAAFAQARIAAGEPPFRPGTKRDKLRLLLEKGVTIERAMEKLDFSEASVRTSLYGVAKLLGRKVAKNSKGRYAFTA